MLTARADTVVVGLGVMGCATAAELARRGQRVIGLERRAPIHAFGSSHGQTRVIRLAYFESPVYVPMARESFDRWQALERRGGDSLLMPCPALLVGQEDSAVLRGSMASAAAHGLDCEALSATEIRQRYPALAPRPEERGFLDRTAGVLRAEACWSALREEAVRQGADLRYGQGSIEWRAEAGGAIRIRTAQGDIECGTVVAAAGAWTRRLPGLASLPLEAQRVVTASFLPTANGGDFELGRLPIHLWDRGDGRCFYGLPTLPGSRHGMKAGFHLPRTTCDPETVSRQIDQAELDDMTATLHDIMPSFTGSIGHASVCLYTTTPDEHFIIDRLPGNERVIVLAGFSGHGFKFAPTIADLAADLALGSTPRHDLSPFRIGRFQPPSH